MIENQTSPLRTKLQDGNVAYGIFSYSGKSEMVEAATTTGIDFIVLDMEASPMSNRDVVTSLQGMNGSICQGIVRVPRHDPQLIGHALDVGAAGVMVPKVETSIEAHTLGSAFRYPPLGTRGINSLRAQAYGAIGDRTYMEHANSDSLAIVQVESPQAISKVAAIAMTKTIDIVFVGIGDLMLSSGVHGQFNNPEIVEARKKVIDECERNDKIPGIFAGTAELASQFANEGFKFIAVGNDLKHFRNGLIATMNRLLQ